MNRQIVQLPLKPHYADFLRHEFSTPIAEIIPISSTKDIGIRIIALVDAVETPKYPSPVNKHVMVKLLLPTEHNAKLHQKFLYIPRWNQERIQKFIKTEFDLRVKHYFEYGYKLGMEAKDIIEAFLYHYNIQQNSLSYEAVKKSDYRNRKRYAQMIRSELQRIVS